MNNQFYDLKVETLNDGTIQLEQRDYCGESVIIDLHPAQVAYIADRLPAKAPEHFQTQPNWAMERIATLERRMSWMRDRFEECYAVLPSDMYKRCPEAPEFQAWLMASIDVATEFCADFSINSAYSPLEATALSPGDGCLPTSVTGSSGVHPEQPNGDLFADRAGEKQNGND
ncbi:MAG: hypothetical protein WAT12_00690 [Candidatus Nitrotoga sp.]